MIPFAGVGVRVEAMIIGSFGVDGNVRQIVYVDRVGGKDARSVSGEKSDLHNCCWW